MTDKILTLTCGDVSCIVEGFARPFNTMRAVLSTLERAEGADGPDGAEPVARALAALPGCALSTGPGTVTLRPAPEPAAPGGDDLRALVAAASGAAPPPPPAGPDRDPDLGVAGAARAPDDLAEALDAAMAHALSTGGGGTVARAAIRAAGARLAGGGRPGRGAAARALSELLRQGRRVRAPAGRLAPGPGAAAGG